MDDSNFYSINRLMEFGMSMAIAQQMVGTMNSVMSNMHVSGAMNPIPQQPAQLYYAIIDDVQSGPYSEKEMTELINNRKVTKDTFVWKPGMAGWERAEQVPEVLRLVILLPPLFNLQ